MSEAIKNIVSMTEFQKKILILGDMFELGIYAQNEHQSIVNQIKNYPWEAVFLIGKNFKQTQSQYFQYETFEEFVSEYKKHTFSNSLILIKDSRSMALERLMEFL